MNLLLERLLKLSSGWKCVFFLNLKLEFVFAEQHSASVGRDLWTREVSDWHSCGKNHWSEMSQTHFVEAEKRPQIVL